MSTIVFIVFSARGKKNYDDIACARTTISNKINRSNFCLSSFCLLRDFLKQPKKEKKNNEEMVFQMPFAFIIFVLFHLVWLVVLQLLFCVSISVEPLKSHGIGGALNVFGHSGIFFFVFGFVFKAFSFYMYE